MHSMVRLIAALSLSAMTLAAAGAEAQARTFSVSEGSQIQFVSEAPVETFTGKSTKASGEIMVDPSAPKKGKATVKVPVASIDTNVELRNEHLQSDTWLDAKKHPNAEFVVTSISGVEKLPANDAVDVKLKGKFTIHGVTKALSTTAKVRWTPSADGTGKGDTLRVQATFFIALEDHQVSIPAVVKLKVAPKVKVNVDLRATAP